MEKITLNGKEYEMKPLTFLSMYQLGEMGFDIMDVDQMTQKPTKFVAVTVAYLTKNTIEKACDIIDKSIESEEITFDELFVKLLKWVTESDFFKQKQAKKK
jgi:hypothetical protein